MDAISNAGTNPSTGTKRKPKYSEKRERKIHELQAALQKELDEMRVEKHAKALKEFQILGAQKGISPEEGWKTFISIYRRYLSGEPVKTSA